MVRPLFISRGSRAQRGRELASNFTGEIYFSREKLWAALARYAIRGTSRRNKHVLKFIAVTACWALLSTAAYAEDANASSKNEWQASKLIHMNVYNGQNQKIGDIKELMLDKSGKVAEVVIGVGGFLGAGEHDVAVTFEQLKWSDSSTTGSGQSKESKSQHPTYPDHAVLNKSKDELKSMPKFNYNK